MLFVRAIRGWNDADGASRIRALYDAVPHGQWIPLDMDVNGIWRYWGNYSFFGAPFIWTTLHNMGGNDGLKGDMRLLGGFPSDATAAGASIAGVGATPEGIDQVGASRSRRVGIFVSEIDFFMCGCLLAPEPEFSQTICISRIRHTTSTSLMLRGMPLRNRSIRGSPNTRRDATET